MKRYFDLSTEEKLALTEEEFTQAVKIEGINRGIKPPLRLDDALNKEGFRGFSLPADTTVFYEICIPTSYSSLTETGLCFQSAQAARNALSGAFAVHEDGYGADKKKKIVSGDFSVREVYITLLPQKWFNIKFEEFGQDDGDFQKLCEECAADLGNLRQTAYDREVQLRKRAEYITLAGGDEGIAANFWAKTERTPFPSLDEVPTPAAEPESMVYLAPEPTEEIPIPF